MPALREGCERNERCGSFAAGSEASRQAQAAMCPISPQRGGGGLFAAKWPAQMSERRQMCRSASGATCLTQCGLCGEATGAHALPTPSDVLPLRSGDPCSLLPQSLPYKRQGITYPHPMPSEARRGKVVCLLFGIIKGEHTYVQGIAHPHPMPSEARRGLLTSPCTCVCRV